MSEKGEKSLFLKKWISSKCSYGHLERSSDNPAEQVLENGIVFPKCPKLITFFSRRKLHLRKFLWTCATQFENPIGKLGKKSQRFFAQDPKFITKLKWKENYFPNFSYRHRESSFEELGHKLLPEGCKDFNVQKWWKKNTFFHKRMSFLKLFEWRRRMQFWEPHQWTFDKKAGIFRSMSKNDIELFFRGKILHKIFLWTREKLCLQPSWGNFARMLDSLTSLSKSDEKPLLSETNFPPKMIMWKHRLANWQPPGTKTEKSRTFRSMTGNDNKILVFFQITFHRKNFYWHVVRSVNNAAWESLPKTEKNWIGFRKWWKVYFLQKKNIFPHDNPMDISNAILTNLLSDKNLFRLFSKNDKKLELLGGKIPQNILGVT